MRNITILISALILCGIIVFAPKEASADIIASLGIIDSNSLYLNIDSGSIFQGYYAESGELMIPDELNITGFSLMERVRLSKIDRLRNYSKSLTLI